MGCALFLFYPSYFSFYFLFYLFLYLYLYWQRSLAMDSDRLGWQTISFCPGGKIFKLHRFSLPGEGDPEGVEHGIFYIVPGAVFPVAHERKATAGKLDTDLMGAACMEPDLYQGGIAGSQPRKFQSGLLYTGAHTVHHKDLPPTAVLEK